MRGTTFPPRQAPSLGDQHLGLTVVDPVGQRVGGEPAEHDGVRGSDAGAGEHRHREFRDHSHVDGDTIATLDAQRGQCIGETAHLEVEVPVGEVAGLARFAHPVVRDLLASILQVSIQTVVRQVERAVAEPAEKGRFGVVEGHGRLFEPTHPLQGLVEPEGGEVLLGVIVDPRPGVGRSGELGRRGEAPLLTQQVLDRLGHCYVLPLTVGRP